MKAVQRAGVLLVIPTLLFSLMPVSPAVAAKPPKKPVTVVALTFDDGDASHLPAARMLEKRGMRGTFYVNSETIDGEGKLTRSQLDTIAEARHEIGGHTLTHRRLTELLPGEQRVQICDDRRALMKMGFRVTTLAYPFGAVDADAKRTARLCGYNAARKVGGLKQWGCPSCPAAETFSPPDRWAVRTTGSVREDTLVRQMKQQVIDAEKGGGGLLTLVFHRVCDDCGLYSTTPKSMDEFLDWLKARKSRNTVVKPLAEALGGESRPLPLPEG